MSIPQARKGRHAAPARPTGHRLAVAAAALAAGAAPLVCGGTAVAATASTQPDLSALVPTLALPETALPFGLPDSLGALTQGLPLTRDLPVNEAVSEAVPLLGDVTSAGGLGLLPKQPPPAGQLVHSALLTQQPDAVAEQLTSALPLANLVSQLAPTSGGPLQLTPHALQDGVLGTLTSGIAPQTSSLTDGLVEQATPLVSQLHHAGVPTVGDVTSGLSGTQVPVVGTVGSVTQMVPVTAVLGAQSPVTGAVQNLNGL